MAWFKRDKEGITTRGKLETPDGIWHQCDACKTTCTVKELAQNLYLCPHCGHHERIGSEEYFELFFDGGRYRSLFDEIVPIDPLNFHDLKAYKDRITATQKATGLDDALRVAHGQVQKCDLVIGAMDFDFIGGSMGSVMGEKLSRGIDYAIEKQAAFMIISKSGGARMMESAYSLMQMAKVSAKLTRLAQAGLPYISLLTDPTTGGVTASFAMLGDFNIAEPQALIGFAGPRIVKETIKVKTLPEGFQRAESLLENGFLDAIIPRPQLREKVADLLLMFKKI